MRRQTVLALLSGIILGAILFGTGMVAGANWYEYGVADDVRIVPVWISHGWEPVPNIGDNPRIMRRPRLHLP